MTVADRIGLGRDGRKVMVSLADGRRKRLATAQVEIAIGGDRAPAVVLVGPSDQVPPLGLVTLEMLRLKVNPVTRQLEPPKFIEYAVTG